MRITDVTEDMLLAWLRRYSQPMSQIDTADRMEASADKAHFERLIKSNPEIEELIHKLSHAQLQGIEKLTDLHHQSLCDIVASTMCTMMVTILHITELTPTDIQRGPVVPKLDMSKAN